MNKIKIGNNIFPTKVALTPEEQAEGLMFKEAEIIVFPYSKSKVRNFWMKNTPDPLDILFAKSGKIINIKHGIPFDNEYICSDLAADLVIELPFGTAIKNKITVGTEIDLILDLETVAKKYCLRQS